MKAMIIAALLAASIYSGRNNIVNSVWVFKVTNKYYDTLKFKPGGRLLNYSCEINYTMQGTYRFSKDTLIVLIKDDLHSENGGKSDYYLSKYFIKKDMLIPAGISSHTYHGKWIADDHKHPTEKPGQYNKANYFFRVK